MKTIALTEVAEIIRSKNAGPFELTLDVLFRDDEQYAFLRDMSFFTARLFAELYGVPVGQIVRVSHFDPARAVKCTLVRPIPSGQPGDSDVYGAQQHAPLITLRVPLKPEPADKDD